MAITGKAAKNLAIFFVKAYQRMISPMLAPSCRFYPSCSSYCIQAIEQFGLLKGIFLTMIRLLKCHPWHPGGYDPVSSTTIVRKLWTRKKPESY